MTFCLFVVFATWFERGHYYSSCSGCVVRVDEAPRRQGPGFDKVDGHAFVFGSGCGGAWGSFTALRVGGGDAAWGSAAQGRGPCGESIGPNHVSHYRFLQSIFDSRIRNLTNLQKHWGMKLKKNRHISSAPPPRKKAGKVFERSIFVGRWTARDTPFCIDRVPRDGYLHLSASKTVLSGIPV